MPFEDKPLKEFELCPDGLHRMRLVWLVDLGTHVDVWEGVSKDQKKILLGFELIDTAMKDGRPFLVSKEYNVSPSQFGGYYASKTSNLFSLAKTMMKADDKEASRIGTIGKNMGALGQILLSHNETTNKEGLKRTYVKIDAIQPLAKSKEKDAPEARNPIVNYQIGDEFPETLPEWIAKKIAASQEMTVTKTNDVSDATPEAVASPKPTVTLTDAEIPF